MSFCWTCFSCSVRSSTLSSRLRVKPLISAIASARRRRISLKERASSESSSLDPSAMGRSSFISATCRVASARRPRGFVTNRRVKTAAQSADEEDGDGREDRRPDLDAPDLLVDEAHVEADVEDAEDVLRLRVGVAGGVAARRLVVDRRDHRERPGAVGAVDDPGPRRRVDLHERLLGGVAEEAGLGVLVDDLRRGAGRREHDAPLLVEDPDAPDPLLGGDRLHHLVGRLAVVREHRVPGGARDRPGELVGALEHRRLELGRPPTGRR